MRIHIIATISALSLIGPSCEEPPPVRRPVTMGDAATISPPPDASLASSPDERPTAPTVDAVAPPRTDGAADQRTPAPDVALATGVDLFKPVHDIFATFCADCHHGDFSGGPGKTYNHLMGMTEKGSECDPPRPRVKPGDPENSVIFQKVSSDTPSCGNRMPNTCKVELGNCLSPKQIAAVRAWILAGAPPPRR